jgi:hypothetical protein
MRYLSVKVLPVVAALLLWAVATPADAGANAWILWHQYTYTDLDRMNDRSANSTSEWRLTKAFESMTACQSAEVSFAGFMAEGLNSGGNLRNWSAKAYGSLVEAQWIVTGALAMRRAVMCCRACETVLFDREKLAEFRSTRPTTRWAPKARRPPNRSGRPIPTLPA